MTQLMFLGKALPSSMLLAALSERNYTVTLIRQIPPDLGIGARRDLLLIVSLEDDPMPIRAAQQLHRPGIPWLAWNRSTDHTLSLLAAAAGAAAVLPHDLTAPMLAQAITATITTAHGAPASERHPWPHGALQQRYRRGMPVHLGPDTLLDVIRGVVAQTMLHADGSEVLLGLYGPGQLLIGHPDDDCAIQWTAHTDVRATVRAWPTAAADPSLSDRLRTRIQLMEAWAAMQARPHLDERLMGLLGLLAEQFGAAHREGTLVDLRLTHTQLASAVGATRSTVTRILGDLRMRGLLSVLGDGERERFCLRHWEAGYHLRGVTSVSQSHAHASGGPHAIDAIALPG